MEMEKIHVTFTVNFFVSRSRDSKKVKLSCWIPSDGNGELPSLLRSPNLGFLGQKLSPYWGVPRKEDGSYRQASLELEFPISYPWEAIVQEVKVLIEINSLRLNTVYRQNLLQDREVPLDLLEGDEGSELILGE